MVMLQDYIFIKTLCLVNQLPYQILYFERLFLWDTKKPLYTQLLLQVGVIKMKFFWKMHSNVYTCIYKKFQIMTHLSSLCIQHAV